MGTRPSADGQIRWNARKPALGGISFYITFLLSLAFHSFFLLKGNSALNTQMLGILSAVTVGFLLGLADDAYNTKPLFKFGMQVFCGLILISTGTFIQITPYLWLNYFLTMFWVIGLMNSINMLDNMDAITTTVSITTVLGAILVIVMGVDRVDGIHFAMLLGVLVSLCSFLLFNWNPSKMYMGDTGSQFLGVFLAAIGIVFFWNAPDHFGQVIQSKQFIVAPLMFIVPIVDTATVTINRLLKGKSPFVGGRDHTTHHLSYFGFSDRGVALTLGGISFASMVLCVFVINYIQIWEIWHFIAFALYFIFVFVLLYVNTRIDWKTRRERGN